MSYDVTEGRVTSTLRVREATNQHEAGSKPNKLNDIIFQKTELCTTIILRTSNPTHLSFF
jgi:hypothetical protein